MSNKLFAPLSQLIDLREIPVQQIPVVCGELKALLMELEARWNAAQTQRPDCALRVHEVAQRLQRSTKWIYEQANSNALPFARRLDSGSFLFSERGLEKFLAGE